MSEDYEDIRNIELKSVHSGFSFSKEMQNASRSELWKRKYGLWTFLSGACDDAAERCYEYINKLADSLTDIDTCNVRSLKSIAESVNLGYLCKNLREDFPFELANLIDLFSIPKHILLNSNRILSEESNHEIEGKIVERAAKIIDKDDKYSTSLLYEIKRNINHIKNILNANLVFTKRHVADLLSDEFMEYVKNEYADDSVKTDLINSVMHKPFNKVLDAIENFTDDSLSNYIKQDILVEIDGETKINYFYILINVCKKALKNEEYDYFLVTTYMNKEENIEIDLTSLFINMINSIQSFDKNYAKNLICFHFYNTIVRNIRNEKLGSYFSLITANRNVKKRKIENNYLFTLNDKNESEFTEDEFKDRLYEFITSDYYDDFINQKFPKVDLNNPKPEYLQKDAYVQSEDFKVKINKNLNKHFLNFVEYVKFINYFIEKYSSYIEASFGRKMKKIDYDVLKINYSKLPPYQIMMKENEGSAAFVNNYDDVLYGDGKHEGVIYKIAKELTDICTNIIYIREQIKTYIQQYSFIGTKRIATDILADFFIKNYSKKDEWNYISDLLLEENIDVSALFKPLSTLLESDAKFSIDVIEYYDNTKYLNIESDLPNVRIGQVLKGYEERDSWWIDGNNLITSGRVSAPVFEDLYAPCSVYVNDFNKKFWKNESLVISVIGETQNDVTGTTYVSDYEDLYGKYFDVFDEVVDEGTKKKFIINSMIPMFERIWETFALSALNENMDSLGEIADIYRKYIGTDAGTHRFENEYNKIFPTIAAFTNINGLVKTTSYADDILFVAKIYYSNIINSIISSTKEMIEMHDRNGVPHEGWRQKHITFHGYSTNYEYAENRSIFSNDIDRRFEIDGPFSYSMMQKIIYKMLLYSEVPMSLIKDMVQYVDVADQTVIDDAYDAWFNIVENGKRQYFNPMSDDFIGNFKIEKIETDDSHNVYTLFKKPGMNEGVIFFRTFDMMISVPLMKEFIGLEGEDFLVNSKFGSDSTVEEIRHMANSCIDFGIMGELMWMFSHVDDDLNPNSTVFKLISFKFDIDDGHVVIDNDSVKFHSNVDGLANDRIFFLNDYIGSICEPGHNYVDFLFSNCTHILSSMQEYNKIGVPSITPLINKVTIPIQRNRLSAADNKLSKDIFDVENCAMPMFIEHNEILNDDGQNTYGNGNDIRYTDHRIWKIERYEDKCVICFETLNSKYMNAGTFDYYFKYKSKQLEYDMLEIEFVNSNFYTNNEWLDKNNITFTNYIIIRLKKQPLFSEQNTVYDKILNLCYEYPKCIVRNGSLVVQFLPFALTSYGKTDRQKEYAKEIAKNIYSYYRSSLANDNVVSITFEDALRNFDKFFFSAEAEIQIKRDSYTTLEFINTLMDEELENPLGIKIGENKNAFIESKFELANVLIENIPFITNCMIEKLKIIVCFENETGIYFLEDGAVDLDLTCYIDDEFEKNKRVGYWNKYVKTRYIEWEGDETNGGHEEIAVDVNRYVKERIRNRNYVVPFKIDLNLCWHDTSQIKTSNVYVIINWQNVYEKVPIHIVGESNKDCTTRSLVITIHPDKNNTLTYEQPKWYPVIKVAYKDKIVAYEDGVPDIQVGFINLTLDELKKYQDSWTSVYEYVEDDVIKFSAYKHNSNKFKLNNKEVDFVSYLIAKPFEPGLNILNLKGEIVRFLSEHVGIHSTYLNLRTKERLGSVTYAKLCVEDLFMGVDAENEDQETGINMIYYGFLNPTYFKDEKTKTNYEYPIEAAMKDKRMSHEVGYDAYWNDDDFKAFIDSIKYALSFGVIIKNESTEEDAEMDLRNHMGPAVIFSDDKEMIDSYLNDVKPRDYSLTGFFKYSWDVFGGLDDRIDEYVGSHPGSLSGILPDILNEVDEDRKKFYPEELVSSYISGYLEKE